MKSLPATAAAWNVSWEERDGGWRFPSVVAEDTVVWTAHHSVRPNGPIDPSVPIDPATATVWVDGQVCPTYATNRMELDIVAIYGADDCFENDGFDLEIVRPLAEAEWAAGKVLLATDERIVDQCTNHSMVFVPFDHLLGRVLAEAVRRRLHTS